MSTLARLAVMTSFAASLSSCCLKAPRFAAEDYAAPTLAEESARLAPRCEQWFVRECDTDGVKAVWFFRPRIDGPAETAAYDGTTGALLYQRQFGESEGWSFTPVRQYGAAPKCRPSLDSSGADRACAWIERRGAPAPAPEATPAPAPSTIPEPAPTPGQ